MHSEDMGEIFAIEMRKYACFVSFALVHMDVDLINMKGMHM